MKKSLVITGAAAIILLAGFKYAADWFNYKSVEGKYSITFPGKPTESVENDTNTDGSVMSIHLVTYEASENEVYMSSFIDMHSYNLDSQTMKQILEESRDGAAGSMKATNVVTTATNLGKDPYIEFVFTSPDATGKDRIYMIDKFQYSVITIYSLSKGITADADKFIGSFKHL